MANANATTRRAVLKAAPALALAPALAAVPALPTAHADPATEFAAILRNLDDAAFERLLRKLAESETNRRLDDRNPGDTTVAAPVPALPAEVLPPSPLASVWAEYQKARAAFEVSDSTWPSPEYWSERAAFERCERIACEFVPRTVEDLAWKIVFANADEDYIMTPIQDLLVAQARQIAGLV